MKKIRILNAEPENYSKEARVILERFASIDEEVLDREGLIDKINDYDALIVRLRHRIDKGVIDKGHQLKVIATATTGLEHIDIKATKEKGIAIISLRGERAFLDTVAGTAEHTFALLQALARRLPSAFESVKLREWDRDKFRGIELQGKVIGIVGYGRLGRLVGNYSKAFGMKVLAFDPYVKIKDEWVQQVDFSDILDKSDIITFHVPLSSETYKRVSHREIRRMKTGVLIINTSRGEVLDEKAILEGLHSGKLGGAAFDVLSGEWTGKPDWLYSNPLWNYAQNNDNVIITPHIGGATIESMRKTEIFIANKLKKYFLNCKK